MPHSKFEIRMHAGFRGKVRQDKLLLLAMSSKDNMKYDMYDIRTIIITIFVSLMFSFGIHFYKVNPELTIAILIGLMPLSVYVIHKGVNELRGIDDEKEEEDDAETDAETDDETDDEAEESTPEGIIYEVNYMELLDTIIDRLREKMTGKITTLNADEIRNIIIATYNVTRDNVFTTDIIEFIVDMVLTCIEIIDEVNSSDGSDEKTIKGDSPSSRQECPSLTDSKLE